MTFSSFFLKKSLKHDRYTHKKRTCPLKRGHLITLDNDPRHVACIFHRRHQLLHSRPSTFKAQALCTRSSFEDCTCTHTTPNCTAWSMLWRICVKRQSEDKWWSTNQFLGDCYGPAGFWDFCKRDLPWMDLIQQNFWSGALTKSLKLPILFSGHLCTPCIVYSWHCHNHGVLRFT